QEGTGVVPEGARPNAAPAAPAAPAGAPPPQGAAPAPDVQILPTQVMPKAQDLTMNPNPRHLPYCKRAPAYAHADPTLDENPDPSEVSRSRSDASQRRAAPPVGGPVRGGVFCEQRGLWPDRYAEPRGRVNPLICQEEYPGIQIRGGNIS